VSDGGEKNTIFFLMMMKKKKIDFFSLFSTRASDDACAPAHVHSRAEAQSRRAVKWSGAAALRARLRERKTEKKRQKKKQKIIFFSFFFSLLSVRFGWCDPVIVATDEATAARERRVTRKKSTLRLNRV